ncbi:MAG: homocysteine S-methyltransferase [Vicinamibacteria bacterium]
MLARENYVPSVVDVNRRAYYGNVNPFAPFLEEKPMVLLDGGLATELERRGSDLKDPLWSAKLLIEAPESIEAVHYDYFRAGADVGTSASYQATFAGFAARGIGNREAERLLKSSVDLVRSARDRFWEDPTNRQGRRRPLAAASIGCYGASLHDGSEYRGDYGLSKEDLMELHRARLRVLADTGADVLAFETIPSKLEAEAIVSLLEELGRETPPAWVSFSCRNPREVSHGEPLAECFAAASASDAVVALGINCTHPRFVSELIASSRDSTDKLVAVYPNSGESWDAVLQAWNPGEPSPPIEKLASEWHRLGARLIGGCCRTTPDTIRAIRGVLGSGEPVIADHAPQRL